MKGHHLKRLRGEDGPVAWETRGTNMWKLYHPSSYRGLQGDSVQGGEGILESDMPGVMVFEHQERAACGFVHDKEVSVSWVGIGYCRV